MLAGPRWSWGASAFALTAWLLAAGASACGRHESEARDPLAGRVFAPNGVALQGYDPVAYFTESQPRKGEAAFAAEHDGAVFWFATPGNRDRFLEHPNRYAPRYGGFCAYGMSRGYKAPTNPAAFTVYEDRLYLNYDLEVRRLWSADKPGRIDEADRHWPTVVGP